MKKLLRLNPNIQYALWTKQKDLNPHLLKAQYAVRGLIPATAGKIQEEINQLKAKGLPNKYSFDEITEMNIGNPMTFGQKPLTFNRQVLSILVSPDLIDSPYFSQDVKRRAKFYQDHIGCSVGAYSSSPGYKIVREQVANFIQRRDGTKDKPSPDDIILTDGASQGINILMQAMLQDKNDGVMIPIPQYPLYSALISLCGAQQVSYYLDEESGWGITVEELEKQYQASVSKGIRPRLLVVINPGNPTGQVLNEENIQNFIKFASKNKLTIFADEVYQENIYAPNKKFLSFRKVRSLMEAPYNEVELFSFHSVSKGIIGECGFRGGYFEMQSISTEFYDQIQKSKTIFLCSNTMGQVLTGLMVTPPSKEEGCTNETIDNHFAEREALFTSLKKRAQMTSEIVNSVQGVSCQPVEGAMYAFPKINLSNKFIQEAKSKGFEQPDTYYCMRLLQETGLVVVPGSGFHQYPGTYHFRMTILIRPEEKMLQKLKTFKNWHEKLMTAY